MFFLLLVLILLVLKQNGVQGVMYRADFANALMSPIVEKCPDVSLWKFFVFQVYEAIELHTLVKRLSRMCKS